MMPSGLVVGCRDPPAGSTVIPRATALPKGPASKQACGAVFGGRQQARWPQVVRLLRVPQFVVFALGRCREAVGDERCLVLRLGHDYAHCGSVGKPPGAHGLPAWGRAGTQHVAAARPGRVPPEATVIGADDSCMRRWPVHTILAGLLAPFCATDRCGPGRLPQHTTVPSRICRPTRTGPAPRRPLGT